MKLDFLQTLLADIPGVGEVRMASSIVKLNDPTSNAVSIFYHPHEIKKHPLQRERRYVFGVIVGGKADQVETVCEQISDRLDQYTLPGGRVVLRGDGQMFDVSGTVHWWRDFYEFTEL